MGTIFDREHEAPEPAPEDRVYAVVQAVTALVPGGAELLNYLITPPLERRKQDWMNEIGESLRELESQRGVDLEGLGTKPEFVDAVLMATQIALRTSQSGKREALRNAVLNATLPDCPDATRQQMFLAMTDRFTELHLRLLKLFQDATKGRTPDGSPLPPRINGLHVLHDAFPQSTSNQKLYRQLWTDLYAAGLVGLPEIDNGHEGDARTIRRTSELGDMYLAFIESPLK